MLGNRSCSPDVGGHTAPALDRSYQIDDVEDLDLLKGGENNEYIAPIVETYSLHFRFRIQNNYADCKLKSVKRVVLIQEPLRIVL